MRVWREFPSGPEGIFLKRGSDPDLRVDAVAPFVHVDDGPDRDPTRLYFAKSFLYPLFAAPFIRLFGTNGFLLLHVLVLVTSFACAYAFLAARSHPVAALVFALTFVLRLDGAGLPGVADAGSLQPGPRDARLLLLALQGSGDRCPAGRRAAQRLAGRDADRCRRRRVAGSGDLLEADARAADVAAAGAVRRAPPVAPRPARAASCSRRWCSVSSAATSPSPASSTTRAAIARPSTAAAIPAASRSRPTTARSTRPASGAPPTAILFEVLVNRDAVVDVFRHNLLYFFVGRHTGFAIYFLPGMAALRAVPAAARSADGVGLADAGRGTRVGGVPRCSTCRTPTRAAAVRSATVISSASTRCSCS